MKVRRAQLEQEMKVKRWKWRRKTTAPTKTITPTPAIREHFDNAKEFSTEKNLIDLQKMLTCNDG